jgi:serine/threonine protein kinase
MSRGISHVYEQLGELGQSDQATVYKVRHSKQQTVFALKAWPVQLFEHAESVVRFKQEAQLLTSLRHRNIAQVFGSGQDETLNVLYIVMEYIQGKTLKHCLEEQGPFRLSEVLEVMRQAASALAYAHTLTPPVIHRNLKPTNIMIEDITGRVVIVDFDVAEELRAASRGRTQAGRMPGAGKYVAPEQLRQEPLTGSADVYALGMMMYEMYTGTQFFADLDEKAVLARVLSDPREYEPYFARSTPAAFVSLVKKSIAKTREKRYRGMADFLNDLEACWWALDETRTVVLQPPAVVQASTPPLPAQESLADIEAQLHQLTKERQRRAATSSQAQVKEVRTQAERVDAQRWAATVFAQGVDRQKRGDVSFHDQHYPAAHEAYQEAISLFTQALQDATAAAAAHTAEQARLEASTAKSDAEQHAANERATSLYSQALALYLRAEDLWRSRSFPEAQAGFREAQPLFEKAQELAIQEARREEVMAARRQARAAKEAAVYDGADSLAGSLLREAVECEQRAVAALEQGDMSQAKEAYLTARHKYESAQRQARLEQQRQLSAEVAARHVGDAPARSELDVAEVGLAPLERHEELPPCRQAVSPSNEGRRALADECEVTEVTERPAALEESCTTHKQAQSEAQRAQARAQELLEQTISLHRQSSEIVRKAIALGDHLLQREKYKEATGSYEAAILLAEALAETTEDLEFMQTADKSTTQVVDREDLAPLPPPRPVHPTLFRTVVFGKYALLSLTCLLLVVGVYFWRGRFFRAHSSAPPLPRQETSGAEETLPSSPEPLHSPLASSPDAMLRLMDASPKEGELTLREGETQEFSIMVEGVDSEALHYTWQVDGQPRATEARWTYKPGFDEGGDSPKDVSVTVSDGVHQPTGYHWTVRVQNVNRPPTIVSISPRANATLVLGGGEEQLFAVEAADPDTEDRLTYTWRLDGREVSREKTWRFRAPSGARTHKIGVAVADQSGITATVEWRVTVQASTPPRQVSS